MVMDEVGLTEGEGLTEVEVDSSHHLVVLTTENQVSLAIHSSR